MKLENELCKTTINGGSCGRIFHDVCNFRLWCMNMKNVNVKVSRRSSTTTGRHQIRSSSISSYTGEFVLIELVEYYKDISLDLSRAYIES